MKAIYTVALIFVFCPLLNNAQNEKVRMMSSSELIVSVSTPTAVTDTLNYFYNKQFFKMLDSPNSGIPSYRSAAATNTSISHMGSVFLNNDPDLMVSGLEARLAYKDGSNAQVIQVNIYLCNVDASLMPLLPPIDSVSVYLGAAQIDTMSPTGYAMNASFGTALNPKSYNMPGNFAVLVRNFSSITADTVLIYRTSSLTSSNPNYNNNNNMGEDLGRIRYNGQMIKTKNFLYPGFGNGTDFEFCVAPIVNFTLQAGHITPPEVNSQPVDTVDCWEPLTFTNTSSPAFTNRFFNLNEFYRHFWPYQRSPYWGFSADSAISWYFDDEGFPPRPNLVLKKDSIRATKYYDTASCFTSCSLRARHRKMTAGGSSVGIRGNVEFSVCVRGCYVGVNELSELEGLSIYPNPVVAGSVFLKGLKHSCNYFVFDQTGKLCLFGTIEPGASEISTSLLPDGLYLLKLADSFLGHKSIRFTVFKE